MNQKNTHDVHEIVRALIGKDEVAGDVTTVGAARRMFRYAIRANNKQETQDIYRAIMNNHGNNVLTQDFS